MNKTGSVLGLSNSWNHNAPYLEHARRWITALVPGDATGVVIVDLAPPPDSVVREHAARFFTTMDLEPVLLSQTAEKERVLSEARIIYIMGGNTFRLMGEVHSQGLLAVLAQAWRSGTPVVGASAGTNLLCPTAQTTNDMPIVVPESMGGVGAFPFQINTHYPTEAQLVNHSGESRSDRLFEFVRQNSLPVLALPESGAILRTGDEFTLLGDQEALVFSQESDTPTTVPRGAISNATLTLLGLLSPDKPPNSS